MEPLAEPAIEAVEQGKTKFVPESVDEDATSTGCATSATGASRASSGGATASRPGTATSAARSPWRATTPARLRASAAPPQLTPGPGRARHLVLLGALAVLDARLAGRDAASCKTFYPTTVLVTGLRHHLLLGGPHDDDGPALHGEGAVPHGVPARAWCATRRARRCRRSKGNVIDPLDVIEQARRRRAALHAGVADHRGGAGQEHQVLDGATSRTRAGSPTRSGTRRASR